MKKFALLGYNIDYSLSPAIHGAAFAALGIDAEYSLISVAPSGLADALVRLKTLDGFNVTKPHKTAVIPFLDQNSGGAAVNTVVNSGGVLKGYNTDGAGFMSSLTKESGGAAFVSALILGAGGTAVTIAAALKTAGARVFIVNRTPQKAGELARLTGAEAAIPDCAVGLVVNCTSQRSGEFVMPPVTLAQNALFFDANYVETPFKAYAKSRGARFCDGLDMLIYQAIAAEELFLDVRFTSAETTKIYNTMRSAIK
ncbi:MAG: shikimate dehydrogenase [Clostridiales bacterium]|jgi:shikimate dehydrogenase|nr:shikimate dehydrogenase [Clostridiales bacterium]